MLALRQADYWATVYRRVWRGTVVTSFVLPVLYLRLSTRPSVNLAPAPTGSSA